MIILYVSRTQLSAYILSPKSEQKKLITTTNYNQEQLVFFFKQLKKSYQTEEIRICLSEQASYIIYPTLNKPIKQPIRELLLNQIQTEIPEQLKEDEWDFKILSQNDSQINAIVFAPVISIYRPVKAFCIKAQLNLSVIEPETLSKQRHQDPVVGIGLLKKHNDPDEKQLSLPGTTKKKHVRMYVLSTLILLITLLIILFILLQ
jgi:hypothetical protein